MRLPAGLERSLSHSESQKSNEKAVAEFKPWTNQNQPHASGPSVTFSTSASWLLADQLIKFMMLHSLNLMMLHSLNLMMLHRQLADHANLLWWSAHSWKCNPQFAVYSLQLSLVYWVLPYLFLHDEIGVDCWWFFLRCLSLSAFFGVSFSPQVALASNLVSPRWYSFTHHFPRPAVPINRNGPCEQPQI